MLPEAEHWEAHRLNLANEHRDSKHGSSTPVSVVRRVGPRDSSTIKTGLTIFAGEEAKLHRCYRRDGLQQASNTVTASVARVKVSTHSDSTSIGFCNTRHSTLGAQISPRNKGATSAKIAWKRTTQVQQHRLRSTLQLQVDHRLNSSTFECMVSNKIESNDLGRSLR